MHIRSFLNLVIFYYFYLTRQLLFTYFISEIWDALRAAAETDITLAQAIVDSAGIIIQSADLTVCYDERGIFSLNSNNWVSIQVLAQANKLVISYSLLV